MKLAASVMRSEPDQSFLCCWVWQRWGGQCSPALLKWIWHRDAALHFCWPADSYARAPPIHLSVLRNQGVNVHTSTKADTAVFNETIPRDESRGDAGSVNPPSGLVRVWLLHEDTYLKKKEKTVSEMSVICCCHNAAVSSCKIKCWTWPHNSC